MKDLKQVILEQFNETHESANASIREYLNIDEFLTNGAKLFDDVGKWLENTSLNHGEEDASDIFVSISKFEDLGEFDKFIDNLDDYVNDDDEEALGDAESAAGELCDYVSDATDDLANVKKQTLKTVNDIRKESKYAELAMRNCSKLFKNASKVLSSPIKDGKSVKKLGDTVYAIASLSDVFLIKFIKMCIEYNVDGTGSVSSIDSMVSKYIRKFPKI